MSARPEQADLEEAIRAADKAATPGTALLVLGSALSWHQQLWAPLWTTRPLFYDNWLWYWHPNHVGTPGYDFLAGHHYPDPERTLDRDYLARHGIGAVVVTGRTREAAAASPLLRPLRRRRLRRLYRHRSGNRQSRSASRTRCHSSYGNRRIEAMSAKPGTPVTVRVNWYPRWEVTVILSRPTSNIWSDGYIGIAPAAPLSRVELVYSVQPLDWAARVLSLIGVAGLAARLPA